MITRPEDIATARKEPDACPLQVPEKAEPFRAGQWIVCQKLSCAKHSFKAFRAHRDGEAHPNGYRLATPAEVAEATRGLCQDCMREPCDCPPHPGSGRLISASPVRKPSPPDAVAELREAVASVQAAQIEDHNRTLDHEDRLNAIADGISRYPGRLNERLLALEKQLRELTGEVAADELHDARVTLARAFGMIDEEEGRIASCASFSEMADAALSLQAQRDKAFAERGLAQAEADQFQAERDKLAAELESTKQRADVAAAERDAAKARAKFWAGDADALTDKYAALVEAARGMTRAYSGGGDPQLNTNAALHPAHHRLVRALDALEQPASAPLAVYKTKAVRVDALTDLVDYAKQDNAQGMRMAACRLVDGPCFCGVHTATVEGQPASADAAGGELRGTAECPICGLDQPHAHVPGDVVAWANTQIARWGVTVTEKLSEPRRTAWMAAAWDRGHEDGWEDCSYQHKHPSSDRRSANPFEPASATAAQPDPAELTARDVALRVRALNEVDGTIHRMSNAEAATLIERYAKQQADAAEEFARIRGKNVIDSALAMIKKLEATIADLRAKASSAAADAVKRAMDRCATDNHRFGVDSKTMAVLRDVERELREKG